MITYLEFLLIFILYGITVWAFMGIGIEMMDRLLTIINEHKQND